MQFLIISDVSQYHVLNYGLFCLEGFTKDPQIDKMDCLQSFDHRSAIDAILLFCDKFIILSIVFDIQGFDHLRVFQKKTGGAW